MNIDEWRSQIKRGTLEFCVLLMIARGECYGYELISRLEKRPILAGFPGKKLLPVSGIQDAAGS